MLHYLKHMLRRRASLRQPRRSYRPALEGLEERCLLAAGLTEFPIPTPGSGPLGITTGPDGNLFFTENATNNIGRVTPSGTITEFPIVTSGSDPSGITQGPDTNLWFAEFFGNKIGQMTPGGSLQEFAVPTANANPEGITVGPDGQIWFTEFQGNKIGTITMNGAHTVTEFPLAAGSGPVSIVTGPDGGLWFTEAQANKIGRMNSQGTLTGEFPLPTANANPQALTSGPDGALWFTAKNGNHIGRITVSGVITEFPIPTANSSPQGITLGPDNNLWFVESVANQLARITPAGVITEVGGLTPGSAPFGITTGPDGNLWMTERDANQIARRTPQITPPQSLSANQLFVSQLYRDLLGREADPPGMVYFSTILDRGLVNRFQVALAIENSPEHRIDVVEEVYGQLLGRAAEPGGLNTWTFFLGQGHTVQQFETMVLSSPEYFLRRGGGTTNGFLAAIYQDVLHRAPDPGGVQTWTQALTAQIDDNEEPIGIPPDQVARIAVSARIIGSAEANALAVQMWYGQFLHRPADPPGLNLFANALQHGIPGELVLMTVLGSDEYFRRASQG
jgi:virginiamycin B lyase